MTLKESLAYTSYLPIIFHLTNLVLQRSNLLFCFKTV